MDRQALRLSFLEQLGLGAATLEPLKPDASTRRYFRISNSDQPMLLMDAPPETEKPVEFVEITGYLLQLGARVPEIYASDLKTGLILIEDLGNATLTNLLRDGADETALYQTATDSLIDMQQAFLNAPLHLSLPLYEMPIALPEAGLIADWYLPARLGRQLEFGEKQALAEIMIKLFDQLPISDMVLVHRDFHVDNLMMVKRRCAMLDYQDALMGPASYDLVSLLEDARRDVDPGVRTRSRHRWQNRHGLSHVETEFAIRFWGAQRHCKVAGIFVRLWLRDGKPVYLRHLDRVMAMLKQSVNYPEMGPLAEWLEEFLPQLSHAPFEFEETKLRKMLTSSQD